MALALEDIATGASHDFAAPVRQLVYLSIHPEILDLSLNSVRANLAFIDRVVVLTSPDAKEPIEAVARRQFPEAVILTDDAVTGGELPADHQARNTWLRKKLYEEDAIEANFLAADEDAIALRPLGRTHFQKSDVHIGYYFLEDMSNWLAGSPAPRASTVVCAMSGACWRKLPTRREPSPVTCRRSSTRAWRRRS